MAVTRSSARAPARAPARPPARRPRPKRAEAQQPRPPAKRPRPAAAHTNRAQRSAAESSAAESSAAASTAAQSTAAQSNPADSNAAESTAAECVPTESKPSDANRSLSSAAPPAEERPVNYFLFKSESESRLQNGHEMKFSIDDLQREPRATAHWDGVRNAEACKCMRHMRPGDLAFFYHSNTRKTRPSIVGVVRVVSDPYPDHTAFDERDPHYDPRSKPHAPRWYMVDVQLVRKFQAPVSLDRIKAHPHLADMQLVKRPRISVQPVTAEQWRIVHAMAS